MLSVCVVWGLNASQVGPCHHSMARPQVADQERAADMEGSCERIELAVAEGRQGVVL
jgi:hypothetical protein